MDEDKKNDTDADIRTGASGRAGRPGAPAPDTPFADRPAMEGYFPHLVSRLINRLNLELLDRLVDYGISVPQWRVLQFLYECDGATINEIARDVVMRQPGISRICVQLEQRGLAVRRKNPENARFVQVYLTERARQLLETVTPIALAISEEALSALNAEERTELRRLLQRVFNHVNRKGYSGRAP